LLVQFYQYTNANAVIWLMVPAKRIYILIIRVNKFSFFHHQSFWKNRKHVLHVSIELQKHSWKLGELVKTVKTLPCWLVFPQHFSFSQTCLENQERTIQLFYYKSTSCSNLSSKFSPNTSIMQKSGRHFVNWHC